MSIIIVGNGTSILDKPNGNKIDSFDTVLRFNGFKIKGHEEYTGIKTNICLLYTSPSPRDLSTSRMPSSA